MALLRCLELDSVEGDVGSVAVVSSVLGMDRSRCETELTSL